MALSTLSFSIILVLAYNFASNFVTAAVDSGVFVNINPARKTEIRLKEEFILDTLTADKGTPNQSDDI